jgi:hypothetical protein
MRLHQERKRTTVVTNEEDPLVLMEIYLNDALEVLLDLQVVRAKLKEQQKLHQDAPALVTPLSTALLNNMGTDGTVSAALSPAVSTSSSKKNSVTPA